MKFATVNQHNNDLKKWKTFNCNKAVKITINAICYLSLYPEFKIRIF